MIHALNKQARYDFEIIEKFEAGIVLTGPEVKSIKTGNINLKGSYISIEHNEVFLKNAHVSPNKFSVQRGYEPTQKRKLLLNKSEIIKLSSYLAEKGSTAVPLAVLSKGPKIKVEFAICKSKKQHDRREDLKKKAQQKEINRALRRY